jgi:hypothetical protein
MNLFPWLLFAHVFGAIIAFGASFSTFPLLGAMSGKEPAHANFGSRLGSKISTTFVRPLAILQGVTGVGLILVTGIDLTKALWLDVAIVLYLIALGYALFVQIPVGHRLVELTSGGPPPTPPSAVVSAGTVAPATVAPAAGAPAAGAPAAGAPAAGAPAAGAPIRPAGPPPELLATAARARQGGMLLAILITAIVFLMVVKPF